MPYVERKRKMKKKISAVLISLILVTTIISGASFSAAAITVNVPTFLYIGINGEIGNTFQNQNLASKLTGSTKLVGYTYEANNYRFKYYKDDDSNYILYLDGYTMTTPYGRGSYTYGIYCVGDLIIELKNTSSFTVADAMSYGIYVDGILTIRCSGDTAASLTAEGGLKGIEADDIIIESGDITSTGRTQYGLETGALLVMKGSLAANGRSYGVKVKDIGMAGGTLSGTADDIVNFTGTFVNAGGTLEGEAYADAAGDNYNEIKLLEAKSMYFKLNSSVLDGGEFKAESPFSLISTDTGVVKVGKDQYGSITASGRGAASVNLVMQIGTNLYTLDSCTITSDYLTIQWIIIIVFFGWLWYM